MKGQKNRTRITGLVMHVLIGGLLIITGSQKVIGSVPPKALVRYGLGEQAKLIAIGAILTALILVIPRTSSLGILLVSSFWGGAVCIHLAHGEPSGFGYMYQGVRPKIVPLGSTASPSQGTDPMGSRSFQGGPMT